MRETRRFGELADFVPVARAAFGSGRRLAEARRLSGGSKKGVYRLGFDDGTAVAGYVWSPDENYWPDAPGPVGDGTVGDSTAGDSDDDPFSDATGAGLFAAAHALLTSLGVRVPELYLLDQSRTLFPADVALVECVPGESLESLLDRGGAGGQEALRRLRDALDVMHGHRNPAFGKVGREGTGGSCEQVVVGRALAHVAEAADRMPAIGAARVALESKVAELAAGVRPRQEYRLIHGELGPDHVLIDRAGEPVLIDIEGLMHFDVEWEHVFLQMRFKGNYPLLRADRLDPERLRLYRLATHLSLVAAPLRIADTDFPDRDFMIEIAEGHAARVLGYLQPP